MRRRLTILLIAALPLTLAPLSNAQASLPCPLPPIIAPDWCES